MGLSRWVMIKRLKALRPSDISQTNNKLLSDCDGMLESEYRDYL